MSDNSSIEWTDATWNPVTGCSVVSPGCTNCYAMRLAGTRLRKHPTRAGLTKATKAGPAWTGEVRLNESVLAQPLRWTRPRMIFVCAHGDLFHESVPDAWIDQVFAIMALSPQHSFQVLTKRANRMRVYLAENDMAARIAPVGAKMMERGDETYSYLRWQQWPLPNVWLGVSAERQEEADKRIPHLLATSAAIRFVSAEPLLGPIDFAQVRPPVVNRLHGFPVVDALRGVHRLEPHPIGPPTEPGAIKLDWVIAGGESGLSARPMHPDWARSIRDQCAAAGVPFFFKQWGNWIVELDREADDPDWRADYSQKLSDARGDIAWLNLAGGRGFHGERFHVMRKVTKKAAGRLLDGVEHNGMPAS